MNILQVTYEKLYEFHNDIRYDEKYIYYAISFNKRIFGYIIFNKNKELKLEYIYIKKEYRNSGLGSKLLINSLYDLVTKGYKNIEVENFENYQDFFEKNNFIKVNNKMILNDLVEEIDNINSIIHVSKFSIIFNIFLSFLKLIFGYLFSLNILIADSINSFSDLINSILILIGAKIDKEPNDSEHPFGHGKIESVFSLITGVILIIVSLNIFKDTILKLFLKDFDIEIKFRFLHFILILLTLFILKIIQYLYVLYFSKKINNPLINAILLDYRADIILSLIVIVGIIVKKYVSNSADLIITLFILIYLMYQGYLIIKENILILMDSQDENLILNIKLTTLEVEGIENIHDVYMFSVGQSIFVIADIRLKSDLTISEAHKISQIAEKKVKFKYSNIKKVIYHIEPIYKKESKWE